MENTIENALAFMQKTNRSTQDVTNAEMMVAYAALITPTKLEQRQATRTKIAEVLDREYETRPPIRIVVPSEEEIIEELRANEKRMDDGEGYCHNPSFGGGARWLIDSIRTLNPGAEVVEGE